MKNILHKYYPESAGLFVFIIYLFTVGRSIGEFDSGELALCQATLSIPHPTGYPLFTLLGYLFLQIPLPGSTLVKLNLLNSIWCSLTVVILIKTASLISDNFQHFLSKKTLMSDINFQLKPSNKILVSIFPGLMLAFSATFWLNSTKVEVYSLQIFLTSVIIYNSIKIYLRNFNPVFERRYMDIIKDWLLIAVLIGLSFSNHLMTTYLLPATIFLFFLLNGINKQSFKALIVLSVVIVSITSLFYLLMMFRAQSNPLWSYGDPSNLQRLIDHITAKEYTKYLLDSSDVMLQQGSKLLKMLSFNLNYESFSLGEFGLSLFLGIAGIILISVLNHKISIYLYSILIVSIVTALVYHIPDINEYFLVSFFILSLSSVLPIIILVKTTGKKILIRQLIFLILAVLVLIEILVNYAYADRSEYFVVEDFFKSSVNELPANSILLTDNWGSILSPALYYQNIEKFRNDVNIISPSGYLEFEWYRKYKAAEILDSNFVIIPRKFTFVAFDVAYRLFSKGLLKLPQHHNLVPMKEFFLVGVDTIYYPINLSERKIRFSKNLFSESEKYIRALKTFMLEQRLLYELAHNKIENAKKIFGEIRLFFPEHSLSENTIRELVKNKIL